MDQVTGFVFRLVQVDGEVPGLLRHPLGVRMIRDPGNEHTPGADVDEEQDEEVRQAQLRPYPALDEVAGP